MFNGILDMLKKCGKIKIFALVTTYILLFSILVGRMFYLQIVKAKPMTEKLLCKNRKLKPLRVPVVKFMTAMVNYWLPMSRVIP